jgi:dTDP-4-dehydrorhamnose 3,5-epimerase
MRFTKINSFDKLFPTLITLDVHQDNRGSFTELWSHSFDLMDFKPIQSNLSVNTKKGTFRGLHFQTFLPQAKMVGVISGQIVDFIVDVRPKSATFGKFKAFWLRPGLSLLVPKGFAHGFVTLEDNTVVNYLVDVDRFVEHERIINILDEKIINSEVPQYSILGAISDVMEDMELGLKDLIMSEKDRYAPLLEEIDDSTLKFVGDFLSDR